MAGSGGKGGGVAANPVPANHSMPIQQYVGGTRADGTSFTNPAFTDAPGNPDAVAALSSGNMGGGFNVNNAASTGMQRSMAATDAAMSGPLNVGAFNNPYQQQVVDTTQADIERQRQMAMNTLGAQAQAAGAYGGSRHGVAEGVTNAEYGRMAANTLAPLRMQGYNTAMANAMADRTARLGAANQLGGMANTAFNTGRALNQDMMQQGLLQQSLQQALIDAARADFGNYAQSPIDSLNTPLAALGVSPKPQSTTTTQNPGLLGTLGALKYIKLI